MGVADHHCRLRHREHAIHLPLREIVAKGEQRGSELPDRQRAENVLDAVGQGDGDDRVLLDTAFLECPGNLVSPRLEFAPRHPLLRSVASHDDEIHIVAALRRDPSVEYAEGEITMIFRRTAAVPMDRLYLVVVDPTGALAVIDFGQANWSRLDPHSGFLTACLKPRDLDPADGGDDAAIQPVPPANFRDRARMATRSDGQLYWQILKGGAPRSEMPAFGPGSDKSWSEEKIWGMVAFLRTLTDAK